MKSDYNMKSFKDYFDKRFVSYALVACIAILFYAIVTNLGTVKDSLDCFFKLISPVIIGAVFAYLFNPVAVFFEKKLFEKVKSNSSRRSLSIALTVICFILVVGLLLVALIPSLAKSVATLISKWSVYTAKVHGLINKFSVFAESRGLNIDTQFVTEFLNNWTDKLIAFARNNSGKILSAVGNIGSGISNFAVGLLFGICFMFMKKGFKRFVDTVRGAFIKPDRIKRTDKLLSRCNDVFIKYVSSTLLDALIIGMANLIFTIIFKMPYAPLIAVIAATTNIIPTFGPMIGTAISMFLLFLDNPKNALVIFIFQCVIQALDGMVIKPKLFKGSLGLPAALTLVLIFFGGKVAGMAGIILSIPFGAIFIIVWRETVKPHLDARKADLNANEKVESEVEIET